MKPKTFGEAMFSIILVIILIPIMVMLFLHNDQDSQSTTQAAISCECCAGACTISHKVACKTAHNASNYYYYTYKCTQCGNEFTVEIAVEKNKKFF